ncbi:MAG TPA: ATP-dependent Clp protease proteolytic subunit [Planctomycetota bacterium]|nr:ATP-dependent Clp protease proteolytic subunit [Planctomycetota bacterium]
MVEPEQRPFSGIVPAEFRVNDAVVRTNPNPGDPMMNDPRLAEDDEKEKDGGDAGMMKRMLKTRSILVFEPISDKLARRVQSTLLLLQQDDEKAPITVYVNSPGGSADSGFAIYDSLRFFKPPVRTVVNGLCASAAVMVYLAAPRASRFSLPNGRFLLHQPSTAAYGSASDIEINAEEIVKLRVRYNEIVGKECGKTTEQVTRDADRDFWLSPEEAQKYGLVGKVVAKFGELG